MSVPAASSNPDSSLQALFDPIIYAQNGENARHLRMVRVLSANAFAVVITACLTALQLVRAHRLVELATRGFLVAVAVAAIQLLISLALKRELDDCMARIERQLEATRWREVVGLPPRHSPWWLHLRWLYTAFYVATLLALLIAFGHRLWP